MTRLAVIGAGRAGTSVALAAADAGYDVESVVGHSRDDGVADPSVERFLELIPTAVARPGAEATRHADLVVVAVPDGVVESVARDLAVADGVRPDSRWIHLSGSLGLAPLRLVHLAGGHTAACHPAQTLPDPERGRDTLGGCAWAVTAAEADRGWARRFVRDLDGVPVDVADSDRTIYHVAMSLGSNAVSAVVALARDLLLGVGVTDPDAFLGPLATTAAAGAAEQGVAALTGPIRRGDADTVGRHLRELEVIMPEALPAYRAIGVLALGQARRAGLDAERIDAVRDVLEGDPQRAP